MNSNPPPSKKKKKEKYILKKLDLWSFSDDFNTEIDTDDNVVKVTCKTCTQYLQQIWV